MQALRKHHLDTEKTWLQPITVRGTTVETLLKGSTTPLQLTATDVDRICGASTEGLSG